MNILPIALIGVVAAVLAFDKRYEDGLIRHIALAGMIVGSLVITISGWFAGYTYEFPIEVEVLIWSWLVFFVMHAISFVRWRLTGANDWTKKEAKQ